MKTFILLFVLFSALFYAQKSPPPPPPATHSVDHMYLVLMWPFGYCSDPKTAPCKLSPLPEDMTIHGLWPVNTSGNSIIDCEPPKNLTYLFNNITLQKALLVNWPNLIAPITNTRMQRSFWSHEYNKHGNCQPKIPKDYFWTGISLKQSTSIFQALKAANIKPGQHYKRAEFEKAIKAKVGTGDICLKCFRNKIGDILLKEIYLCTDAQSTKVIPCPKNEVQENHNCGNGTIKFVSTIEYVNG